MNHIQNKDIELMIWETHPERRKKNKFAVNVNIVKNRELNVGDKLLVLGPKQVVISTYTVEEVKSKRPSSLKKYDYVEAVCTWVSGGA